MLSSMVPLVEPPFKRFLQGGDLVIDALLFPFQFGEQILNSASEARA